MAVLLMCQPVMAGSTPADGAPDLELLEFLGTWHAEDGTWIEPTQFADEGSLPGSESALTETTGTRPTQEDEPPHGSDETRDDARVPAGGQTDDTHGR